jgi:hypothetical protein
MTAEPQLVRNWHPIEPGNVPMKCGACDDCERHPMGKRCIYGGPFVFVPYSEEARNID